MMTSDDSPDHEPDHALDSAAAEKPGAEPGATAPSGDPSGEGVVRPGISAVVWIPVLSAAVIAGLLVVGWQSFAL